MAGSECHISLWQVFKSEVKLSLQQALAPPDMQDMMVVPMIPQLEGEELQMQYAVDVTAHDPQQQCQQ